MAKRTQSKSKRVRDYLDLHPEAKTPEIVEALGKYGVKNHDVANVFNAKRKEAGQTASTKRPRGRPRKSESSTVSPSTPAATASSDTATDAALQFIQKAGGIDQAIGILQLIQKVIHAKLA